MARRVFKNGYISINGKDISTDVKQFSIEMTKGLEESQTMGDDWFERLTSIRDFNGSIDPLADEATDKASDVLWDAWEEDDSVDLEIRADRGSVSATNPKWTGKVHVQNFTPVGGSHGEIQMAPATLVGDGPLTKATS